MFADIIKDSIASYCMEDAETYKVIIAFDFRGISPTEFSPRVIFYFMASIESLF